MDFNVGLNVITGKNAAGKTSLLEAIYLLGRVGSFRTAVADRLISTGKDDCLVVGKFRNNDGRESAIGISRHPGRYRVHMNGEPVKRLSDLAGEFPVYILSNDTQNIITGGPKCRRHALDWALFHVEQGYRDTWQRLNRVLKQRNAALRRQLPATQVTVWDEELIYAASGIDRMRKNYLETLAPYIAKELAWLVKDSSFGIRYQRGWSAARDYGGILEGALEKDRVLGYTQYGPHRADFILQVDDQPASNYFSRGQVKALTANFLIGQARLQRSRDIPLGAFLIDDFASELDRDSQARLLDSLANLKQQVFVTSIETDSLFNAHPGETRRFHVEHGAVEELL